MLHLAHSRTGSGRPFVWAHGLTSSRANEDAGGLFDWSPVEGAGRELIRYDAPGHGETAGPPDPSAYEWSQLAADLLGLADHLRLERVSAGGASMGSAAVLHAAVRAPERFDRLVLACPPTAWDTRPAQSANYELVATFVEQRGMEAFTRAARAMPRPAIFAGAPEPDAPDITEALLPSVFRGAAASDLPAPDDVRRIAQPVLILAWDTDPGHPISTAERLVELLPAAELHVATTLDEIRAWPQMAADFLH
ncbi:MAG: alpha/beta fold hydrolase [Acidimicrobiales bacterium]